MCTTSQNVGSGTPFIPLKRPYVGEGCVPRSISIDWCSQFGLRKHQSAAKGWTYEIEQTGNAVRLTMSEAHDRPLSDDILSGGRQGWPAILSSLKSLLETGKPLTVKMGPPERMLAALKAMGIKTP